MISQVFIIVLVNLNLCQSCEEPFEGFGVFLGQLKSFNKTSQHVIDQVLDLVYYDLGIRLFRTEILHEFSRRPGEVKIRCESEQTCTWINVHRSLARLPPKSVFASIWSPPHYMKVVINKIAVLRPQWKRGYYDYIKTTANLIRKDYLIDFEQISIVNEPDDIFAAWDHLNMSPIQLCNYLLDYNDPQLRICPETAWFINLRLFMLSRTCRRVCEIIAVHGYLVNIGKQTVHYDTSANSHSFNRPIWMTEISGPFVRNGEPQMQEAIDLAISIINFVGHSCVRRYYYWLAFTTSPSGESLIWFDQNKFELVIPKKYYVYRQFSKSSYSKGPRRARLCAQDNFDCLRFDNNYVFVNNKNDPVPTNHHMRLCCTSETYDLECGHHSISLPPKSVCSSIDAHHSDPIKLY